MFADARYVDDEVLARVRSFAREGGQVIATESSFRFAESGIARPEDAFADLVSAADDGVIVRALGSGRSVYIPRVPRDEQDVLEGTFLAGPPIDADVFGAEFLSYVREYSDALHTNAPWTSIVHAYQGQGEVKGRRIVLHLVNFDNDESSDELAPLRTERVDIDLRLPEGTAVERAFFASPGADSDAELDFAMAGSRVRLEFPPVEVYGLVVIELAFG